MSAAPAVLYLDRPERLWEGAGVELAVRLEFINAATIVGADSECVAHVALGAARASCGTRRVVIADLLGDAVTLSNLAGGPGTDGLTDGFIRGQTLSEIARPAGGASGVFILPTGRGRITEELVASERWQQIARGFADIGALLLIATRPSTPSLASLVRCTAGVIAVDVASASLAGMQVLTTLRLRDRERNRTRALDRDLGADLDSALERSRDRVRMHTTPVRRIATPAPAPPVQWIGMAAAARPWERWIATLAAARPWEEWFRALATARPQLRTAGMVAGALTVVALGSVVWRAITGGSRQQPAPVSAESPTARPVAAATRSAATPATLTANAANAANAASNPPSARDAGSLGAVVNPDDSAAASVFAVELLDANSVAGAGAFLRDSTSWPGANGRVVGAVVPLLRNGDVWYRAVVGAWRSRDAASSLLGAMRDGGVLRRDGGRVVRVPYALVLNSSVTRPLAVSAISGWRALGIHAYALTQNDGTVRVFAGAFESPLQAAVLAAAVRTAGTTPVLAFRTGSAY